MPDDFFRDWKEREALAEGMIPIIGKLYREKNVSTYMYGNNMVNMSVIDLMKAHRFVRQVESNELSELETYPMIEALSELQIGPAHIDIGKMVVRYQELCDEKTIKAFLELELEEIIGSNIKPLPRPKDVVLYGFGRIGRLITRLLIDKAGGGDVMRLRAIVIRPGDSLNDLTKRAALLRQDSVHGSFKGTIRVLEGRDVLVVNGNPIKIIYADSPSEVDYTKYGISDAIVIDNTGAWRDEEGLSGHLRPGASKVILTAPAGGAPAARFKEFETFKTLWRYGLVELPEFCSADTPPAACAAACARGVPREARHDALLLGDGAQELHQGAAKLVREAGLGVVAAEVALVPFLLDRLHVSKDGLRIAIATCPGTHEDRTLHFLRVT